MLQSFQKTFLLMAIAVVFAIGLADNATAQVTLPSIADIPIPNDEEAAAYYHAATGDVILAVGADLFTVDLITSETFIVANLDGTTPLGSTNTTLLNEIRFNNALSIPLPVGVFNIGNVFPADPSITDVASFQARYNNVQTWPNGSTLTGPVTRSVGFSRIDYRPFNVIATVPEPGAFGLLALIGLVAVARRQR